jgi:hypothetical protein
MPTLIDELVVRLGLDSKGLSIGADESTRKMRALEDQIESTKKHLAELNKTSDKKSEGYKKEQELLTKQLEGYKQKQKAMRRQNEDAKKSNELQKESAKGYENVTSGAMKFLAVLGSAVAVKSFVADSIQANYQLAQMSVNLNASASSMSSWGNMAKLFGGSAADVNGTFQMMRGAQYQLFHGSGAMPGIGRYYTQIGLGLGEFNKTPEQQMLDIQRHSLNRFGTNGKYTPEGRNTAYQAGLAAGIPPSLMMMILNSNTAELKQSIEKLKIGDEQLAEQAKLATTTRLLSLEFTKLGYDILHAFSPFIDWITDKTKKLSTMDPGKRDAILSAAGLGGAIGSATLGAIFFKIVGLFANLVWKSVISVAKSPGKLIRGLAGRGGAAAAGEAATTAGEVATEGTVIEAEAGASAAAAPGTLGTSLIFGLIAIVCTAVVAWMITHWDTVKQLAGKAVQAAGNVAQNVGNSIGNAAHAAAHAVGAFFGEKDRAEASNNSLIAGNARHADTGQIVRWLTASGWSKDQAIGLAARIHRESNGNANQAERGGGHGYGLMQWSPARQRDFAKWAGHDIHGTSVLEQLNFLHYELLHGKERWAGKILQHAKGAAISGAVSSLFVARPRDREGEAQRTASYAQYMAGIRGASHNAAHAAQTVSNRHISNNRNFTTGDIHVHTAATDAHGIARDIKSALGYEFTSHAVSALQ